MRAHEPSACRSCDEALAVLPALVSRSLAAAVRGPLRPPRADFGHLHTMRAPLAEAAPTDNSCLTGTSTSASGRPWTGSAAGYRPRTAPRRFPAQPSGGRHGQYAPRFRATLPAPVGGWPGAGQLFTEATTGHAAPGGPRSRLEARHLARHGQRPVAAAHLSLEKRVKRISAAIHKLLAGFPPA
jgi:hypothetical protein